MKSLKIIIGLLCIALTVNTFKNGIPIYTKLALYAEYIPILIVFIIGVLLLKSTFKPEEKKNVNLVSNHNENFLTIEQIDNKINILENAYNDGLIEISEFEEKKEKFLLEKKSITSKIENYQKYKKKEEKLIELFNNDIISKEELEIKIDVLKQKYDIESVILTKMNADTKIFYISEGTEHGPVTIGRIAYLIEINELNPNCFIRLENENSYKKRINEILEC